MTPRDIRNERKQQFQLAARKQLGLHSGIRVFPSAEGALSPLTVSDAASISRDLKKSASTATGAKTRVVREQFPASASKATRRV
jgi:hypothetical protein